MLGKVVLFYETDKRKIQEDREILAHQLQAGQRKRSFVYGYVYSGGAGVRMVGTPRTLTPNSKLRS
jgi:hypothetical protein